MLQMQTNLSKNNKFGTKITQVFHINPEIQCNQDQSRVAIWVIGPWLRVGQIKVITVG